MARKLRTVAALPTLTAAQVWERTRAEMVPADAWNLALDAFTTRDGHALCNAKEWAFAARHSASDPINREEWAHLVGYLDGLIGAWLRATGAIA